MVTTRRPARPYATKTDKDTAFLLGQLAAGIEEIQRDISEIKDGHREIAKGLDHVKGRLDSMGGVVTTLTSDITVMGGVLDKQTRRIDKIEPIVLKAAIVFAALAAVGTFIWANWDRAVTLARAVWKAFS